MRENPMEVWGSAGYLKPVPAAFGTAANPGSDSKDTRDRHSAFGHRPNTWQNKIFLPILGDCQFVSLTLFFWLRLFGCLAHCLILAS